MPGVTAKLVSSGAITPHREISLCAFPLRLGRCVRDGISIDDRWVSREHCEIDRQDNRLVIRDLGSKHGTYVNGRAIQSAPLSSGDEVSLGLTRFVVDEAAEADDSHEILGVRLHSNWRASRVPADAQNL